MKKQEIIGVKETLYTEKLDNGLSIYMLPNSNVKNFYITLNVKYGSIYTKYKNHNKVINDPKGIAHYLEHLMFNMPDGDAFNVFSNLGSYANAFTSNNITCYDVFSNTKFKENLEYLLEFVYTPYFTKSLVDKEKGIIAEEIKMYEDDISTKLFYDFFQNIFINDERRYLITGLISDLSNINVNNIKRIYETFYHPKNMFLIITGNFSCEEAVAIVQEKMKEFNFKEYSNPELLVDSEPFTVNKEYQESMVDRIVKPKAVIGYKIPKSNFKSLKISEFELKKYLSLIMFINFGSTSLINDELKSNGIITNNIGINFLYTDDYCVISFAAETNYPDYFVKRIKETFDNLSLNDESVKRKIKTFISNYVYSFDDISEVNNAIQNSVLNYGIVLTDYYTICKSLKYETAKKVMSKLNKYLCSVNIIKAKN